MLLLRQSPQRRSSRCMPPRCSYPRPDVPLPQLHGRVVVFDGSADRLLPRPAAPLQQPPCALHRVAHVEQAADQRLHPCQRPPLVGPTRDQRTAFQLPLKSGDLLLAEPRSPRRTLRQGSGLAALTPLAAPPLHRSIADPQRGSDLPALLLALEAFHGLQPDPLPRGPPCIGQPTALRVSHAQRLPKPWCHCQAIGSDITQSSSEARFGTIPDLVVSIHYFAWRKYAKRLS